MNTQTHTQGTAEFNSIHNDRVKRETADRPRAALMFNSLGLSETPTETARPRTKLSK